MTVAEVDLRPGGTWRYAMIANGGFEVASRAGDTASSPAGAVTCQYVAAGPG